MLMDLAKKALASPAFSTPISHSSAHRNAIDDSSTIW